jgi:formate dehydrogenase maturation protein FdhE
VDRGNSKQDAIKNLMTDFADVKNQIRLLALAEGKGAKDILAKMNGLEKIMDDVLTDLTEEVKSISERIDLLNEEFFTKIFRNLFKEIKDDNMKQSQKVIEHIDAGLGTLQQQMLEVQNFAMTLK